jgi:hypothetical protein
MRCGRSAPILPEVHACFETFAHSVEAAQGIAPRNVAISRHNRSRWSSRKDSVWPTFGPFVRGSSLASQLAPSWPNRTKIKSRQWGNPQIYHPGAGVRG